MSEPETFDPRIVAAMDQLVANTDDMAQEFVGWAGRFKDGVSQVELTARLGQMIGRYLEDRGMDHYLVGTVVASLAVRCEMLEAQ